MAQLNSQLIILVADPEATCVVNLFLILVLPIDPKIYVDLYEIPTQQPLVCTSWHSVGNETQFKMLLAKMQQRL